MPSALDAEPVAGSPEAELDPTAGTPVGLVRLLPYVLLATTVVAVLPGALVWELQSVGVIHSAIVSILLGVALSLTASYIGSRFWKSRPHSRDLLWSARLVWGWLRRLWVERQPTNARRMLDGVGEADDLGPEQRTQLLRRLAAALELGDPYTHGHSRRVARHATAIAERMKLPRQQVAKIRTAAALHDIGKISTPTAILHKPGRLTDAEFDVIKLHPERGAQLVSSLGDAQLTAMVLHHHERLDGTGYPDRISGDDIPLGSRIISVADTFDAITSTRPYRAANTHKKAIDIMATEAGTQLDPYAVQAFRSHYSGRRPFALWLALTNVPERLAGVLGNGFNAAAMSTARVMTVSALTGAMATAGAGARPLAKPIPSADRTGGRGTADVAARKWFGGGNTLGAFGAAASHSGSQPAASGHNTAPGQKNAGGGKPSAGHSSVPAAAPGRVSGLGPAPTPAPPSAPAPAPPPPPTPAPNGFVKQPPT